MKAVLLSIQPKWCELIASDKKTVEIRKTKPKLKTPFKVYIYCTKDEPLYDSGDKFWCKAAGEFGNGKVIGEFICDSIIWVLAHPDIFAGHPLFYSQAIKDACLTQDEVEKYSGGKDVYGWHISDLVIYDKPKGLGEFWSADKCPYASEEGCTYKYHCFRAGQTKRCGDTLTRPPQSWCYVEELEEGGAE